MRYTRFCVFPFCSFIVATMALSPRVPNWVIVALYVAFLLVQVENYHLTYEIAAGRGDSYRPLYLGWMPTLVIPKEGFYTLVTNWGNIARTWLVEAGTSFRFPCEWLFGECSIESAFRSYQGMVAHMGQAWCYFFEHLLGHAFTSLGALAILGFQYWVVTIFDAVCFFFKRAPVWATFFIAMLYLWCAEAGGAFVQFWVRMFWAPYYMVTGAFTFTFWFFTSPVWVSWRAYRWIRPLKFIPEMAVRGFSHADLPMNPPKQSVVACQDEDQKHLGYATLVRLRDESVCLLTANHVWEETKYVFSFKTNKRIARDQFPVRIDGSSLDQIFLGVSPAIQSQLGAQGAPLVSPSQVPRDIHLDMFYFDTNSGRFQRRPVELEAGLDKNGFFSAFSETEPGFSGTPVFKNGGVCGVHLGGDPANNRNKVAPIIPLPGYTSPIFVLESPMGKGAAATVQYCSGQNEMGCGFEVVVDNRKTTVVFKDTGFLVGAWADVSDDDDDFGEEYFNPKPARAFQEEAAKPKPAVPKAGKAPKPVVEVARPETVKAPSKEAVLEKTAVKTPLTPPMKSEKKGKGKSRSPWNSPATRKLPKGEFFAFTDPKSQDLWEAGELLNVYETSEEVERGYYWNKGDTAAREAAVTKFQRVKKQKQARNQKKRETRTQKRASAVPVPELAAAHLNEQPRSQPREPKAVATSTSTSSPATFSPTTDQDKAMTALMAALLKKIPVSLAKQVEAAVKAPVAEKSVSKRNRSRRWAGANSTGKPQADQMKSAPLDSAGLGGLRSSTPNPPKRSNPNGWRPSPSSARNWHAKRQGLAGPTSELQRS